MRRSVCDGLACGVVVRVMSTLVSPSDQPSSRAGAAPRQGVLDSAAFDVLFRECAADVHGYLISLLGDRAAAEDATALAFERLYRSRSRLDHRRGTPRAMSCVEGGGRAATAWGRILGTIGRRVTRSRMWSVARRCVMRSRPCRF